MPKRHSTLGEDEVHRPYTWTYENESQRLDAEGFFSADIGKDCRQLDNESRWTLTNHNPPTWAQVGGYTHPSSHPATMIDQDSTHQFVASSEKITWNNKQDALGFTPVNVSSYTASDVLTKIKTVDGTGSGLDADLLDGHEASYFQVALGFTPQTALGFTPENASNRNALNGYAGLNNGKIDANQLPAIAITDTFVVNTQAAMLALVCEVGDVAVRTDLNKSFILKVDGASTLANWQELLSPTSPVQSVAGKTGVVTLIKSDIGGIDQVDNTSDANKPVSTAQATAIGLKVTANNAITGASKCKITYDSKGLVTSGADLAATDIPSLDWAKITSGKPTTLAGYGITDGASSVGKQTIFIPAGAMTPRVTNGASLNTLEMPTNKNMFKTLDFDTTTVEYAQFDVCMPKSWNGGTVTFKFIVSHASGSGNVAFKLSGLSIATGENGDAAFGTAVGPAALTVGTANYLYLSAESGAITITGAGKSEYVMFRIERDTATDTLGVDARLHGVQLFYTTDAATDA